MSNPNDFFNHWLFGQRFAEGTFIYEGGLNYVYPPLWAMVHAPLTLFSPHVAKAIVFPLAVMGPSTYWRTMHFWVAGVLRGVGDPDPSRGPLGEEKVENMALRPALARYLMHLPYGHLGRPETSDDPTRPNDPPSRYYLQFLDLTPNQAGWVVRAAMAALLLLVICWLWRVPKGRDDPALVWEWAAISLLILLYSPITWKQHGVGVFPALYLICRASLAGMPVPRPVHYAVGAYAALVIMLNRAVLGRDLTKLLDSYRVKTIAMLVLLAAVLMCSRALFRRPPVPERREERPAG